MNLEKVAAEAFLDELRLIADAFGPETGAKLASVLDGYLIGNISADELAGFWKEAGVFDGLKNFIRGGVQNGIPMQSLGQQMAAANPLHGMGSSLAQGARAVGGSIANAAQRAGGAVRGFVQGGTNAQGIPMHGLGQMAADSNPLQGMGSSLAQGGRSAAQGIRDAASRMWRGGSQNGIPMMGMQQQIAASNPFHGMGSGLMSGLQNLRSQNPPQPSGGTLQPQAA